jgi:hypothetical protein
MSQIQFSDIFTGLHQIVSRDIIHPGSEIRPLDLYLKSQTIDIKA